MYKTSSYAIYEDLLISFIISIILFYFVVAAPLTYTTFITSMSWPCYSHSWAVKGFQLLYSSIGLTILIEINSYKTSSRYFTINFNLRTIFSHEECIGLLCACVTLLKVVCVLTLGNNTISLYCFQCISTKAVQLKRVFEKPALRY